jgi:hypothetical protein
LRWQANYRCLGGVVGVVVVAGLWLVVAALGIVVPLVGLLLELDAEAGAGTPDWAL